MRSWEKIIGEKSAETSKHIDELVQHNEENKIIVTNITALELKEIKETIDHLISIIEDQDCDIDSLKEKIEDLEEIPKQYKYIYRDGMSSEW